MVPAVFIDNEASKAHAKDQKRKHAETMKINFKLNVIQDAQSKEKQIWKILQMMKNHYEIKTCWNEKQPINNKSLNGYDTTRNVKFNMAVFQEKRST